MNAHQENVAVRFRSPRGGWYEGGRPPHLFRTDQFEYTPEVESHLTGLPLSDVLTERKRRSDA